MKLKINAIIKIKLVTQKSSKHNNKLKCMIFSSDNSVIVVWFKSNNTITMPQGWVYDSVMSLS